MLFSKLSSFIGYHGYGRLHKDISPTEITLLISRKGIYTYKYVLFSRLKDKKKERQVKTSVETTCLNEKKSREYSK